MDHPVTIGSLLEELYQKAGMANLWSLVRHTAGMLKKRVEDLGPVSLLNEITSSLVHY